MKFSSIFFLRLTLYKWYNIVKVQYFLGNSFQTPGIIVDSSTLTISVNLIGYYKRTQIKNFILKNNKKLHTDSPQNRQKTH